MQRPGEPLQQRVTGLHPANSRSCQAFAAMHQLHLMACEVRCAQPRLCVHRAAALCRERRMQRCVQARTRVHQALAL